MKLITYCNKLIEYSFYSLLFLVPLVFSGDTSELFEFNKMWLTFGITAVVGGAWAVKMIAEKRFVVQRTPFDIPLLLFLLSQIISSIFSLDPQVSWWGYYSRFNGGLLSTICYILLYYAFVTNVRSHNDAKSKLHKGIYFSGVGVLVLAFLFTSAISGQDAGSASTRAFTMGAAVVIAMVLFIWSYRGAVMHKIIFMTLNAGFLTALWAFPAHFGYDPTCLVFRGTFDTNCWTDAFRPTDRTFSTLGQPAWLAAYMAFLIPVASSYALKNTGKNFWTFYALSVFFYISLIFTDTRAGYIGFWLANILFWGLLYFKKLLLKKNLLRTVILFNISFLVCSFIFGGSLGPLTKFTLPSIMHPAVQKTAESLSGGNQAPSATHMGGITNSGDIRLLVWKGAIKAWENNPLFGTGVETYAFAYYKYKSPAHNLTSEWDYLYNKAHNEYLNYLATTGIFGLGTYLAFLGVFIFVSFKWYRSIRRNHVAERYPDVALVMSEYLTLGLFAGWVSILITNFFGFSVVIVNLYLFLVPVFMLMLTDRVNHKHLWILPRATAGESSKESYINPYQWTGVTIVVLVVGWMIISLIWYRQADIAYALGNNLDKTGAYQQAYPQLSQAVQMEPNEPTYKDEFAINLAALAAGFYGQKDTTHGNELAQTAIQMNDDVVNNHPNDVVYWKNRVRLFYTLSASDPANSSAYLQRAMQAIDKAKELAPTDAKIAYNQGVLYGQAGQIDQAISMLNQTIQLKPNYADAYVALGLFYHQKAVDKNGKVINNDLQKKAIDTYQYVLKNLTPGNKEVEKSLAAWQANP